MTVGEKTKSTEILTRQSLDYTPLLNNGFLIVNDLVAGLAFSLLLFYMSITRGVNNYANLG